MGIIWPSRRLLTCPLVVRKEIEKNVIEEKSNLIAIKFQNKTLYIFKWSV